MSNKQELIKEMLEMQKMFMEYEHANGVSPEEYYLAPEGHPLHQYRQKYRDIAMQLVDIAHAEKGSHR
ncbi:hypothetical protein [Thioalkalivibrio sulfidiphilus]|uniref:Uncharacterized protein n=1 Tax=Thioalkalivibrio sulfidiphilus (strain HL-EbGR7) TaxID=396588 RepID=B8GUE0_THISH|nr:hypothetical protein [Thioalkalivibrio sulfidiphilus]ACL73260.1 hypothetical protein Tgr7_2180 [Thioalkalivibrio sulfidiphilus HL-EbGr7]